MHRSLSNHLATHHALVSTSDMLALGLTKRQIQWMVTTGELVRMFHGVYRSASVAPTVELRVRAGLLAAGEHAVLSHRAAVAWHGVPRFQCDLVEVTARSASRSGRDGLLVHRSVGLAGGDIERRRGVLVTRPARSLVDAAAVLDPRLVARWSQQWIADRKLRLPDLDAALRRAGNHPGARRLRPVLTSLIDGVDSVGEAVLGSLLRAAGLPPELHVLVTTEHGHTFELDWAYPDAKVGLELDGYGVHLRSAAAFDDDRWRRNELTIAGWTILNFTSRQCRRPERVASQVRRVLVVARKAQ